MLRLVAQARQLALTQEASVIAAQSALSEQLSELSIPLHEQVGRNLSFSIYFSFDSFSKSLWSAFPDKGTMRCRLRCTSDRCKTGWKRRKWHVNRRTARLTRRRLHEQRRRLCAFRMHERKESNGKLFDGHALFHLQVSFRARVVLTCTFCQLYFTLKKSRVSPRLCTLHTTEDSSSHVLVDPFRMTLSPSAEPISGVAQFHGSREEGKKPGRLHPAEDL